MARSLPCAAVTTSDDIQGIDRGPVTEWMTAHIDRIEPPLEFDLIAGGHSNLTFRVSDQAGGRWVLRRPPLGQVLATAHDMGREHKIISALAPTDVPVPPTVGLCSDESVNGAPFYVMDFVAGQVVRDAAAAEALSVDQRQTASESIIDVMASIHAVDLDAVGLSDLGRHEGYIERQLKRWYSQYQASKEYSDVDFPLVDKVHDALLAQVPRQQGTSIVHGDYRLDNCMLGDDGRVAAVLDWEICTLGDPLADVGLLWVYWADPDSPSSIPQASPTTMSGFLSKAQLMDRYSAASGLDLSAIGFYIAFGFWKLTCIIAGVYSRYAAGAMGDSASQSQIDGFKMMIDTLATQADDATARLAGGA
jgi:aminoglycoside phosphotransferase (APT) family kinase protein